MPACRGNLERTPRQQLTAHVGEIERAAGARSPIETGGIGGGAMLPGSFSARTASASDETATTSRPDTIAASLAFDARQQDAGKPVAPRRGGNRQHAARRVNRSVERQFAEQHEVRDLPPLDRCPAAARMPSAIGRSNDAPALRTSAGARLTVMRCGGNSKPELRIALRTRSRLSRTLASGRPTIVKRGQAERDVDFDVDRTGIDAEDRRRPKAREHDADTARFVAASHRSLFSTT